jgi:hypothetical protein
VDPLLERHQVNRHARVRHPGALGRDERRELHRVTHDEVRPKVANCLLELWQRRPCVRPGKNFLRRDCHALFLRELTNAGSNRLQRLVTGMIERCVREAGLAHGFLDTRRRSQDDGVTALLKRTGIGQERLDVPGPSRGRKQDAHRERTIQGNRTGVNARTRQ